MLQPFQYYDVLFTYLDWTDTTINKEIYLLNLLLLKCQVLYQKCIQQTESRKKQHHLIYYIYFYKKPLIFIQVLFALQMLFIVADARTFLVPRSPTFLLLHKFSSPAEESVGSGEIIAAVQPSEAHAD